jgi:hypothetical protein
MAPVSYRSIENKLRRAADRVDRYALRTADGLPPRIDELVQTASQLTEALDDLNGLMFEAASRRA